MACDVPNHFRLGPHQVVIRSDAKTAQYLREDNMRADCRMEHLVIRIDPDRPQSAVAESLLHEILHAIWAQTPLNDKSDEETIITALSPWLLGVLQDNENLVEFFTHPSENSGS